MHLCCFVEGMSCCSQVCLLQTMVYMYIAYSYHVSWHHCSLPVAQYSESFITTAVLGNDLVIRSVKQTSLPPSLCVYTLATIIIIIVLMLALCVKGSTVLALYKLLIFAGQASDHCSTWRNRLSILWNTARNPRYTNTIYMCVICMHA